MDFEPPFRAAFLLKKSVKTGFDSFRRIYDIVKINYL